MSIWIFSVLMGLAWLTYPIAGTANTSADVLEGKRPRGAGFSFLPELLFLPAVFLGAAELLDHFIAPWGRRIVGSVCVVLFVTHLYVIVCARRRMRAAKDASE
jgi:hypothetical protein